MHVHALTLDRGGCFYYRVRQPLTALREHGHWTSWGSGMDFETWDRADVLVSQYLHDERTVTDWCRWAADAEKLGKVLVWEADDDIFSVHTSPAHGNAYDDPETLPRMRRMLEASHLVTVTTEALAAVYRPHNSNVRVLPNCVPDWLVDEPLNPVFSTDRRVRFGYTGSASHFEDFLSWSPIFERWQRRNANRTTLALFGHNGRPKGTPITWRVTATPWEQDTATYLRSLNGRMDVGLAFLRDTEFNSGKSPIKAMEYAALGIPCVATDHPIYRSVIVPGVTGFLCRSTSDWLNAMRVLADDPEFRCKMGDNAREHARQNFVQSRRTAEWESAYRTAAEKIGVTL